MLACHMILEIQITVNCNIMLCFTSYIILCTRSNSPSNDASRSRARGLNLTRRPWPVRSDDGFFRLVLFTCSTQGESVDTAEQELQSKCLLLLHRTIILFRLSLTYIQQQKSKDTNKEILAKKQGRYGVY